MIQPDFRKEDDQTKSRIISIWDQSLTAEGTEAPPAGFSTGVEYTRAQIEDELDGTPTNFVREKDTDGHGSHVAGTAAGNGMAMSDKKHKGFAPKADIVIVKGGDNSIFETNTINALTYFQNVATALNKPIVVNMSLGTQRGPHDGTEAHEVAVNEFTSSAPGRMVVIAAGNFNGGKIHRQIELEPNAKGTYTFTVDDNTNSPYAFEAAVYSNHPDGVIARLTTPDGQQYTQNASSDTAHGIMNGGLTAIMHNYQYTSNRNRFIKLVVMRPTGSDTNYQGTYTLEIENTGTQKSTFHGWLTKVVNTTLENGDDEYVVSSPGNASDAITVAAYMGRGTSYTSAGPQASGTPQESIYHFSSQGPRVDGAKKPDITASGENVISVRSSDSNPAANTIIYGTDYYKKSQGTSMASPGVAGAVALLLQAKPTLTNEEVKTLLFSNARKDAATGEVPNYRWGYGKLDIYKALTEKLGCVKSNFEIVTYDSPFIMFNEEKNVTLDKAAYAVRYTPTLTGKLGAVSFATGATNNDDTPTDMPVIIQIRKVDANGNPGDIIGTKTLASWVQNIQKFTWNYIDVSDLNIQAVTGKDFYIVINGSGGKISIKADNTNTSRRTAISLDGTAWYQQTFNLKMRATVYEDITEVKNLATTNQTKVDEVTNGYNYFTNECQLISRVEKETESTVTGNVTSKVWTDNIQPDYVSRRFQINPETNATTASGKVTLYFKQAEFDAYNLTNTVKLPTSPTDDTNKQNLIVEKYSGVSAGNIGTVASYGSTPTTITPNAADIVWNNTYQYWEVSFQTTGFGGYFVKTNPLSLGTLNPNATDSGVSIYPNPAKEIVNINIGKAIHAIVTIYDASGKLVKTQNINTKESKIDVSGFTKGTYLFNMTLDKDKKVIKKIIKE